MEQDKPSSHTCTEMNVEVLAGAQSHLCSYLLQTVLEKQPNLETDQPWGQHHVKRVIHHQRSVPTLRDRLGTQLQC